MDAFAGRWQVKRLIDDHLTGRQSTFSGEADFSQEPGRWRYTETGMLKTGAGAFSASRTYFFEPRAEGVAVFFETGADFHSFAWSSPIARHDCSPDLYHVAYRFAEWPVWQAGWHVRGPRKHYSLSSRYARP
ncbi:MAG: DUF6314 family protein [Pseudomonadota bacterium]